MYVSGIEIFFKTKKVYLSPAYLKEYTEMLPCNKMNLRKYKKGKKKNSKQKRNHKLQVLPNNPI